MSETTIRKASVIIPLNDVITDGAEAIRVKEETDIIDVGKPDKMKFFRTLPGKEWEATVNILEMKDDRTVYLCSPTVATVIPNLVKHVRLHLSYYMSGDVFLVPVGLPLAGVKWNKWHETLDAAVKASMERWVRVEAEQAKGRYKKVVATDDYPDPVLPADMTMQDYVSLAFEGKYIDNPKDPIILKILGMPVE